MTDKQEKKAAEIFLNRELSWCEFNVRVLEEAIDQTTPLLERFRFASIVSSNLDEYFMVRIAGLRSRIATGDTRPDPSGMTPQQTLDAVCECVKKMLAQQDENVQKSLLPQAREHGIELLKFDELSAAAQAACEARFESELFPVLTPMAVDPAHPFPNLINLSLTLAVVLAPRSETEKSRLAVVPLPAVLSRLIQLPGEKNRFLLLEDLIRHFLPRLFAGQEIQEHSLFRITRDAEFELDDEGSPDLMETLQGELRKRRTNPVVRFEVEKEAGAALLETFRKLLDIGEEQVYQASRFLDYRFLASIADLPGMDSLRHQAMPPQIPSEFEDKDLLWPLLRERDILLHHPYESFEPVVQLATLAASDPDVLAIKQTLYRTSGDSPIVRALAQAAQNGKQVTVLVELMARFDEERNITWAKQLERAGAHVIYGLVGLKTHAKILLIIRREKDGIRRYVHLGTGNYNDRTARLYTDFGMLTSDDAIGADASGFFNTITGYSDPPAFRKLVMAPVGMRDKFLHWIQRENVRANSGQHAVIHAKMNSLVDTRIIEELYAASQAGVHIRLIVRGICCLKPGVKGLSENIRVISIVDRFLEHSRLFHFFNGGDEEYYAGSADWMPRNLDRRVELVFPIESSEGREKLKNTFEILFADNVKARILNPDGTYQMKKRRKNEEPIRAQEELYKNVLLLKERPRPLQFKPQASRS